MTITVVCRTVGCKSEGLITTLIEPEALVICGYCQIEITDKTPTSVEEETLVETSITDSTETPIEIVVAE